MRYEDITAVWQKKQIKIAADIACEMNGNGVAFIYRLCGRKRRVMECNLCCNIVLVLKMAGLGGY